MADVSKLFEKAEDAVRRRSYDLAVDLYQQILVLDADSEKARLALRDAELKKVNEFGAPSKFMASAASLPGRIKGTLYGWMKKADLAAIEFERVLAQNPRNAAVSFRLGRALEASGYWKSALAVYKGVTLWDPENLEAFLAAGAAARRLNRIEEALELYTAARNLNPKEKTASDAVRDLSAMISLKPREEAATFRDLIKKPEEAKARPGAPPAAGDAGGDAADLQARVDADPADREAVLALATSLERARDYKGLLTMLQKAVQALPADRGLLLRLREANVAALEARLRRLEARPGAGGPGEDVDVLRAKLQAARVARLKTHIETEPTRSDLRFDLGLLLFEDGKMDDAIACFQQVKKDPKRSRDASFWLGRAFLEKGKFNLAVNQLESALSAETLLDAKGKETLYFLGKAKSAAGDLEGARKHFERIYEEDIGFKDVAQILEELG